MRPALFIPPPSNGAIFQEMVILNEVKDLVVPAFPLRHHFIDGCRKVDYGDGS